MNIMANEEHLRILKSGVEEWNKWREDNREVKPDLRSADLSFADLSHANLRDADLSDANLSDANLIGANLIDTDLRNANLRNANLSYTIIDQTDFDNCRLRGTIFNFTNLSKAKNLDKIIAGGECSIDFRTLQNSPNIPRSFLKKIGLPELYIDYLPDFYDGQSLLAYPVFLSHASEDHELSTQLYQALSDKGVLCWFDEKEILPGNDIYKEVVKNIKLYDKMVLVCSEASIKNSWWVENEIREAKNKENQLRESTGESIDIIVPITIDNYVFEEWDHKYKTYIMEKHIGDFRNWQDASAFEEALQKLMKALKVDRRGEAPPSVLNIDLPK